MKLGVSEIARILGADRSLVQRWAFHFGDYLGPEANPSKGLPRQFSSQDLRVLAYVSMYWEDSPDLEAIRIGLNTQEHHEESYDNLLSSVLPFFQELPEGFDETWRYGATIGGMINAADLFVLAESYKYAGDVLVDAALASGDTYELIYPVMYNYRHAVELYMKATVPEPDSNHNLGRLLRDLKVYLDAEFGASIPAWFENTITSLHAFDPASTIFRYGVSPDLSEEEEPWIDLVHIKRRMGWFAESFQKIRRARDKT